jgi:hypothetical protein
MIDTLFWLTGMVTWFCIVLACAMTIGVDLYDRSVMRRARARARLDRKSLARPSVR